MSKCSMNTYWSECARGFSADIVTALGGRQGEVWREILNVNRPEGEHLQVLDTGCGPGFFSILLAQQGHEVTAIDVNENMLSLARENAEYLNTEQNIKFARMDAQKLDFPDESFDLVVSRNITWLLTDTGRAYSEWLRVLKPGGRVLNFDGNWFLYLFDEKLRQQHDDDLRRAAAKGFRYETAHRATEDEMDAMMRALPLSSIVRPDWDEELLRARKGCRVTVDRDLPREVMDDKYATKNEHTPMFMVRIEKEEAPCFGC